MLSPRPFSALTSFMVSRVGKGMEQSDGSATLSKTYTKSWPILGGPRLWELCDPSFYMPRVQKKHGTTDGFSRFETFIFRLPHVMIGWFWIREFPARISGGEGSPIVGSPYLGRAGEFHWAFATGEIHRWAAHRTLGWSWDIDDWKSHSLYSGFLLVLCKREIPWQHMVVGVNVISLIIIIRYILRYHINSYHGILTQ